MRAHTHARAIIIPFIALCSIVAAKKRGSIYKREIPPSISSEQKMSHVRHFSI